MTSDRVNKLRYRAWRRGFLEADLVLGPFADARLETLDTAQLDEFELLLEQPDPDLYAWITDQAPAPPALDNNMLNQIRAFRHSAKATREILNARES